MTTLLLTLSFSLSLEPVDLPSNVRFQETDMFGSRHLLMVRECHQCLASKEHPQIKPVEPLEISS